MPQTTTSMKGIGVLHHAIVTLEGKQVECDRMLGFGVDSGKIVHCNTQLPTGTSVAPCVPEQEMSTEGALSPEKSEQQAAYICIGMRLAEAELGMCFLMLHN